MKILREVNNVQLRVCDCHYSLTNYQTWTPWQSGRERGTEKWRFVTYMLIDGVMRRVQIHRLIMGFPEGVVDHRDADPSNNDCSNLRVTNQTKNNFNQKGPKKGSKSGYKGVYWHKAAKKWAAECRYNGKKHYLGIFDDVKDAARAYNIKAQELDPEFANLNEVPQKRG